ncbi:hypothetical protein BO83DRAFT_61094 [Aspergillus eucalypticola CBS 122712]|uniref:Uncharacterized protein n=1 Tax=Aspergillus eucalypticola (strain CBS 122712 / IBT 29274) TaxID=1448314 RepID=A0A317VAG6_ASPEC|nr:uncharacterized protein BO83DRAFT_61094 [Aspergillus eucalypticola CBS 122712]PWY69912.1 hypothetical protein BO83DRAFT_61094 [Aspergillus eucalypticola CBS 122712]
MYRSSHRRSDYYRCALVSGTHGNMPAAAATADAMHELCRCSDHLMHQVKRGRRNRLHPISSQKQISSEQQRQWKQTQSDTSQKDNLKHYPRSSRILSWCSFFFSLFLIGLRRILMVIWNCSKGGEHVRCAGVGWEGKELGVGMEPDRYSTRGPG